jgi:hypothetical protein
VKRRVKRSRPKDFRFLEKRHPMRRIALTTITFFCASVGLFAATLTLSTGGTYSGGTPATAWTAPGATWSISFNVASNPTVNSSASGGSPVSVGTVDVAFYNLGDGGLIDVGLFGSSATGVLTNGFVLLGPQVYSGPEATPTILPNLYAETSNTLYVAGTGHVQTNGNVTISGPPATTPAPPSLLLTLVGLTLGTAYLTSRRFSRS